MLKNERKLRKTNLYELVHVPSDSMLILGTNSGLKISLLWAKSVLVPSEAEIWSPGFDAAREHGTNNQSILPLITVKR